DNPLSSILKNIVEVYASIQNGLNFGTECMARPGTRASEPQNQKILSMYKNQGFMIKFRKRGECFEN
ncbi:hypothetical protein CN980_33140, partial [Bacillus cereus]